MKRLKLAILISGRGSNMEALLKAAAAPDYPAEPVLVLSNRPDALGLETALAAGVPALAIDHKAYGKDREAFERAMDAALTEIQGPRHPPARPRRRRRRSRRQCPLGQPRRR